jgi:cytochrome c biogenesis protein CcmG/thiol:disulfide interchange protein DsbE
VKKKLLIGVIAAVAATWGVYFLRTVSPRGNSAATAKVDSAAPDFSLPELTGGQFKLSGHRGQVVLLDFWATWCDPCREEIPGFVALQNKYGRQGLQIVGVSMDDGPEPVRAYRERFGMHYAVVMGNAKIGELYGGILGLPVAFVIGRDGRIISKHVGATDISVFETEIVNLLRK